MISALMAKGAAMMAEFMAMLAVLTENGINGAAGLSLIVAFTLGVLVFAIFGAMMIIEMLVTGLIGCLPQLLMGLLQLALGILQALPSLLLSPIQVLTSTIVSLFSGLWTGFSELFAPLASWFNSNVIQPVVEFFRGLWSDTVE
jgi:hypothetical protein